MQTADGEALRWQRVRAASGAPSCTRERQVWLLTPTNSSKIRVLNLMKSSCLSNWISKLYSLTLERYKIFLIHLDQQPVLPEILRLRLGEPPRIGQGEVSYVRLLRCYQLGENDHLGLRLEHYRGRMDPDLLTRVQLKERRLNVIFVKLVRE